MKTKSGIILLKCCLYLLIVDTNLIDFCEGFYEENAWLMQIVKRVPAQNHASWRMTSSCKCGVMKHNETEAERIVGGVVSKPNAWPWMAAIVHIGDGIPKILCGASVINNKYLLTAAHCGEFLKIHGINKFQVYLGTNNLNDKDMISPKIDSVLLHPRYNPKFKGFDIGLIKLKYPVKFSRRVSPICITPQTGVPYVNKEAIVAGWGTTLFGGKTATMQMQTMVNVTDNKSCQKKYSKAEEPVKISPYMMCASAPGSDSCQGDSGGPLFLTRKGQSDIYEQIGVVSFGSGCADDKYPVFIAELENFWLGSNQLQKMQFIAIQSRKVFNALIYLFILLIPVINFKYYNQLQLIMICTAINIVIQPIKINLFYYELKMVKFETVRYFIF